MRAPLSHASSSSQINRADDVSDRFWGKPSADPTLTKTGKQQQILWELDLARKKRKREEDRKNESIRKYREKELKLRPRFVRGLQDEVFEHIDEKNGENASGKKLVCWSFENFHLKRKFCAATREKFWEYSSILKDHHAR